MDGEQREIPVLAIHSDDLVDELDVVNNVVAAAAATLGADAVDVADDLNVSDDDVAAGVENVVAKDSIPRSTMEPTSTAPFPEQWRPPPRRYPVRRRRPRHPRMPHEVGERERRRDFRRTTRWIGLPRNRRGRRRVRRKTANRS